MPHLMKSHEALPQQLKNNCKASIFHETSRDLVWVEIKRAVTAFAALFPVMSYEKSHELPQHCHHDTS